MLTAQLSLAEASDHTILAQIALGSEEALDVCYARYGRLAFAVALRIVHDPQTAEEVVQDVFAVVWRAAASYRAETGRITSWLMAITRHQAISTLRTRRERSRRREVQLVQQPLLDDITYDDPTDLLLLRAAVTTAIAELPELQRQAIKLAYYGGLSSAEIAARQGIPLGTIKTRLRLGLRKLRPQLHGWKRAGE